MFALKQVTLMALLIALAYSAPQLDNVVTGQYTFLDPYGALITVTYTADSNGYREEHSEPKYGANS